MAPEVLQQNLLGYCEKSDIYSVGITTCELANGIGPFADLPTTLMLTEKIRGNQPSLLDFSTFPSEEVIFQAMDSGIGIGEAGLQIRLDKFTPNDNSPTPFINLPRNAWLDILRIDQQQINC
jgi:serine/threonine protein kinase